jgi:hypothetical protein
VSLREKAKGKMKSEKFKVKSLRLGGPGSRQGVRRRFQGSESVNRNGRTLSNFHFSFFTFHFEISRATENNVEAI